VLDFETLGAFGPELAYQGQSGQLAIECSLI
jgi:hypothetical protein